MADIQNDVEVDPEVFKAIQEGRNLDLDEEALLRLNGVRYTVPHNGQFIKIAEFEKVRNDLNEKFHQRYILFDKYMFHVFADNIGMKTPRLLGVYSGGKLKDCHMQP